MNTLDTLYFPDTAIFSDRQLPIFLLFTPVHILQPVETDTSEQSAPSLPDTFMDGLFCQAHTPSPLQGDDLNRFLRLIKDIKNRKDDYAAQLSALTVASLSSSPQSRTETSKNEIISSILGQDSSQSTSLEIEAKEKLWQARLVLKIAEILDHEEEEIAEALSFLDNTEVELFEKLKGSEDQFPGENPYEDLMQLRKKINPPRRETINSRMRAWIELLKNYGKTISSLWLTTRSEAADILLEKYERTFNTPISPFFSLELPAKLGIDTKEALINIENFHRESKKLRTELSEYLGKTLKHNGESIPGKKESENWLKRWGLLVENHFPEKSHGRLTLSLYLFETHPSTLLGGPSSGDEEAPGIMALMT